MITMEIALLPVEITLHCYNRALAGINYEMPALFALKHHSDVQRMLR